MRREMRAVRRRGIVPWTVACVLMLAVVLSTAVASAVPRPEEVPPVRIVPAVTPSGPRPVLQPVGHWEQRYLDVWVDEFRMSDPLSRSADSWDHYQLSYDVDANTAMYRATGRTRYLDRALHYVNNVVATARVSSTLATSQYRDNYLGWVSKRRDLRPSGVEVPLYESYFWRYATTMLRVIRQTPELYADPAYRGQYDRLLGFAEVNVFEKWSRRGANDNIYRSRAHMASHWALIALNLCPITDDAGRRGEYRTVVHNIDLQLPNAPTGLHKQLRGNPANPSAYFWSDEWGSFRRPGTDVSHGNNVMAYVVEARDQGDVNWTAGDMDAFAAILGVIWRTDQTYSDFVDGTGTGNGWFSDGFVKLGRYSPTLQQRLEDHAVFNNQFIANMALNARILG